MALHEDLDWQFSKFSAIHNARNALGMAWMRCQPTASLIAQISDADNPASYYACRTLSERILTDEEQADLAAQTRLVLSDDFRRTTTATMRPKLDRLLLHTSQLMSKDDAKKISHEQLQHRTAARRRNAVRVIHRLGVDASDSAPARAALVTYGEAEAITLLALLPKGLKGFDCCSLLQISKVHRHAPFGDASFIGAVALQGLAKDGLLDHEHACITHPLHYIRAAGRLRDPSLEGYLTRSIDAGGVEVLPMAVSVAGRLQLSTLLTELEARLQKLVEDDPQLSDLFAYETDRSPDG